MFNMGQRVQQNPSAARAQLSAGIASFSWDSTGYVATVRPNGSGNSFGFTTMFNGNSLARPRVSCRVG